MANLEVPFGVRDWNKLGDRAEKKFYNLVNQYKGNEIRPATNDENMHEHFDFVVNGRRIDVKSERTCGNLNDDELLYTTLEVINKKGQTGWLYGNADDIAFEVGDIFMIIERKELIEYHLNHTKMEYVSMISLAVNKLYKMVKDVITIVPMHDLLELETCTVLK